jgi:hypothetical protein|tara:strand:+ start:1008 stop:1295 length:288 start_codon:yes stop_codon:yes gene_type:complete
MKLPVEYSKLDWRKGEKRIVREQYIVEQKGLCYYCNKPLKGKPPTEVTDKPINLSLFPKGFLNHPIHLQHNHDTDITEGAVHAYCNAVLWQYEGR